MDYKKLQVQVMEDNDDADETEKAARIKPDAYGSVIIEKGVQMCSCY